MPSAVYLNGQVLIMFLDCLKKAVTRAVTVLTKGLLAKWPLDNKILTMKVLELHNLFECRDPAWGSHFSCRPVVDFYQDNRCRKTLPVPTYSEAQACVQTGLPGRHRIDLVRDVLDL